MSLSDKSKNAVRAFYASVSSGLPGFKPRHGQRQMIAEVSRAISSTSDGSSDDRNGSGICVVEGQTGTGKSIAYLVPSLVLSQELGKKLIISSATVSLQEQLIDRDIPAVMQFHPNKDKVKIAIAKGRSRYVCSSKLTDLTSTSSTEDLFGTTWDRPPRREETDTLNKLKKSLGKQWNGDRDDLDIPISDDLWLRVTNDSYGCTGKNCSDHDSCSFIESRTKIRSADVIVMNHDFLLSSLKSEFNAIPPLGDCILVLDEAHHVPDIAIKKFAVSHSLRAATTWIERMGLVVEKIQSSTKSKIDATNARHALRSLHDKLAELVASISHSAFFSKDSLHRYPNGALDQNMQDFANEITLLSVKALIEADKISSSIDELRKTEEFPSELLNRVQSEFGVYYPRLENLNSTWLLFSKVPDAPIAKWLELSGDDFIVAASPLIAADVLTKVLWDKASSVVLTSATITTLGTFDYFLRNTGLSKYPATTTLSVQSPFNFREQGQILIPRMKSDPKNFDDHTREIIDLLPNMLRAYKGSLVLFASKKQMTAVHDAMLDLGVSESILLQGHLQKKEILKVHAEKIALGHHSAIFGLQSFGEGVDLPGELCAQVIITKIPFAPPDSPIEMALQEWVESRGGNAFNEVSLPKAGLKLTQWVGRLIRSECDTGRVVFLDSRMYTSRYKQKLLSSLPDFSVVYE